MADKLYLYDTAAGSVLAKTETPLRSFEAQAIDKGYILSGMGDDGMMVYIYDSALTLTRKIAVNQLLREEQAAGSALDFLDAVGGRLRELQIAAVQGKTPIDGKTALTLFFGNGLTSAIDIGEVDTLVSVFTFGE